MKKRNELLQSNLQRVKRVACQKATKASTTYRHDFLNTYIANLGDIIDMNLIFDSKINKGVDPLGGADFHYWECIAKHYNLNLEVVNKMVDPTFSFMTLDWDGQIRIYPSFPYAMQRLIAIKDDYDISFACGTRHDRHGIVTKSVGLLNPNYYLSVAVFYLLHYCTHWHNKSAVGKTVVTTQLIDRIAAKFGRKIYDLPVVFKWFVDGLLDASLCFGREESGGATFSRLDGKVWTTDKDGFVPALLLAELSAKMGKDPGIIYKELTKKFGEPWYYRIEANATLEQKDKLKKLSASQIKHQHLAGEKITNVLTIATGNNKPVGGLKVTTKNGWFAARPCGREDIYKKYGESFLSKDHLKQIIDEAQTTVNAALQLN